MVKKLNLKVFSEYLVFLNLNENNVSLETRDHDSITVKKSITSGIWITSAIILPD